jgi:hypothetical protein
MENEKPVSTEEFNSFKDRVRALELSHTAMIQVLIKMLAKTEIDPELIKRAEEAVRDLG